MSNENFASAAKPLSIGGGVYVAPFGTVLPTSTEEELDAAFVTLGYISTDGVARNRSDSTNPQKAWGGATVAHTDEGYTETIKFKVIDAANVKAQELAFGEASGDLTTGITSKSVGGPRPTNSYVVDMLLKNNVRRRTVVPKGTVSAVGEVAYKDNDLIGYDLTVSAEADSADGTVYEYTKASAQTAAGSTETGNGTEGGEG